MTQGGHPSLGSWTLFQALIGRTDMTTVLREEKEPFLWPQFDWEKKGMTPGTTVANGLVPFKGTWMLYYGAGDTVIGLATCPVAVTEPSHGACTSRLAANLAAGKPQTVVTYGTSLTAGGAWVQELQDALGRSYPGKATVVNSGMGAMWSGWGVENLGQRVIAKKPDTVLIEFSINDAYVPYTTSVQRARSNLETMIDRILASNTNCEIVLMVMNPPTGSHLEQRPKIKEYNQMYRDVAKNRKLLLIDHYPHWEKILNDDPGLFMKCVPDGIHPCAEGCTMVVTPEILRALGITTVAVRGVHTGDSK